MSRTQLLLEAWQVVGQHPDLGEVLRRLAPALQRHLPTAPSGPCPVWLRRVDPDRGLAETLACAGIAAPEKPAPLQPAHLASLLAWHRAGALLRAPAAELLSVAPGLLPIDLDAEVMALPLGGADRPLALVVAVPAGRCFQPRHEAVLRCVREVLQAAVANDRRLRELTASRAALEADNQSLLTQLGKTGLDEAIVGVQGGLRAVMQQVEMVSRSDVPVLLLGETGSGKEVIARAIHNRSHRRGAP